MIFSNSLMRRREDVPLAEFFAHWLDPHGPMTALLPGTRRYVQNHVIDSPGTNAAARALRVDGFAQLGWDTPDERRAAHGSPQLAACNTDSALFIGGVSRIITESLGEEVRDGADDLVKQIVVSAASPAGGDDAVLDRLGGIRGLVRHRILEQARAPNSAVPYIGIAVDSFTELWVDPAALADNAALLAREAPGLATFAVRVHSFI